MRRSVALRAPGWAAAEWSDVSDTRAAETETPSGTPPDGVHPHDAGKIRPLSSRNRGCLAGLLAVEALGAVVLIGYGISWVVGAAGDNHRLFPSPASERPILTLDVPRFSAYVVPLGITALTLAIAAISTWRTRHSPPTQVDRCAFLTQSLLLCQPFLLPLGATAWLLIAYGAGTGIGDPYSGSFGFRPLAIVIVGLSAAAGVAVAATSLLRVWHAALRVLAVPLAVVLALCATTLLSVSGIGARGEGFSSATYIETGVVSDAYVSCPGPLRCIAFGASFIYQPPKELAAVALTTDGGRTWRDVSFPVTQLFRATRLPDATGAVVVALVACPTPQRCLVARAEDALPLRSTEMPIARTADGGKTWTILPAPLPPSAATSEEPFVGGLACMTASRCVLADQQAIVITRDGGTSWQMITAIPRPAASVKESSGAVCSDTSHCVVYFSWESQTGSVSSGSPSFHDTYRTVVLTTSDGGATWRRLPLPAGLGVISALWCGRSGECILSAATDGTGFGHPGVNQLETSTDSGHRWVVVSPSRTAALRQLSCDSSGSCFALGSLGNTGGLLGSRDGGRSWSLLLPGDFSSFSCAETLLCAVSGTQDSDNGRIQRAFLETTDGGTSWRRSLFPLGQVPSNQRPFRLSLGG